MVFVKSSLSGESGSSDAPPKGADDAVAFLKGPALEADCGPGAVSKVDFGDNALEALSERVLRKLVIDCAGRQVKRAAVIAGSGGKVLRVAHRIGGEQVRVQSVADGVNIHHEGGDRHGAAVRGPAGRGWEDVVREYQRVLCWILSRAAPKPCRLDFAK